MGIFPVITLDSKSLLSSFLARVLFFVFPEKNLLKLGGNTQGLLAFGKVILFSILFFFVCVWYDVYVCVRPLSVEGEEEERKNEKCFGCFENLRRKKKRV